MNTRHDEAIEAEIRDCQDSIIRRFRHPLTEFRRNWEATYRMPPFIGGFIRGWWYGNAAGIAVLLLIILAVLIYRLLSSLPH
jgi:hypothetical protein